MDVNRHDSMVKTDSELRKVLLKLYKNRDRGSLTVPTSKISDLIGKDDNFAPVFNYLIKESYVEINEGAVLTEKAIDFLVSHIFEESGQQIISSLERFYEMIPSRFHRYPVSISEERIKNDPLLLREAHLLVGNGLLNIIEKSDGSFKKFFEFTDLAYRVIDGYEELTSEHGKV
jgi:hypothetical protein